MHVTITVVLFAIARVRLSCGAVSYFFFFFNDTATTEIYTLSLHDALPISSGSRPASRENRSAYPTSVSDDREMSRKRRNSFRLRREDPSTMLTAAENAARRVCEVRPYCSSLGKDFVTR